LTSDGRVRSRKVRALRFVFNALFGLSGLLFVLAYLHQSGVYAYTPDVYFQWAIVCLFLGFFINLVYATR